MHGVLYHHIVGVCDMPHPWPLVVHCACLCSYAVHGVQRSIATFLHCAMHAPLIKHAQIVTKLYTLAPRSACRKSENILITAMHCIR